MKHLLITTIAAVLLIVLGFTVNARGDDQITWKGSGVGGAVAAGEADSVAAGIRLLEKGGNAADAAAATLLALAVTDYGLFAIGGEVPLIIYDAGKKEVKVLSGLGAAPLDPKAIQWYYKNGIPANGSMKSAPVPGAVDLVVTALKLYGTVSFKQAVQPTLELLDAEAEPWQGDLAVTLRKLVAREAETAGSRREKLTAVRDRFYKGDIADDLEAWYIKSGAFLRKSDLENHRTRVEDPVSVTYRGYTIFKCGPWTQGPYLCQTLKLLEGFKLRKMGHLSASYIHTVVESLKLALADRDEYYGDPRFTRVPLTSLFSDEYTGLRRKLIDPENASILIRPGDPYGPGPLKVEAEPVESNSDIPVQDTTTCVVADRWGNVVAATPSANLVGIHPRPERCHPGEPGTQPKHDARPPKPGSTRETPPYHPDADACAQGRQAGSCDQCGRW